MNKNILIKRQPYVMKALIRNQYYTCSCFTEEACISGELERGQCNTPEEWEIINP